MHCEEVILIKEIEAKYYEQITLTFQNKKDFENRCLEKFLCDKICVLLMEEKNCFLTLEDILYWLRLEFEVQLSYFKNNVKRSLIIYLWISVIENIEKILKEK